MHRQRGEKYQALIHMAELSMDGNQPDYISEGWRLLANAIIIRAIRDYEEGRLNHMELYRFLHSDWFQILSRGCVSPESILKEVTTNGKKENKGYGAGPKNFL